MSAVLTHFRELILTTDPDAIPSPAAIPPGFLLARSGRVGVHYIPFDYVNPAARVVLVGITPGFAQWKNAVREARKRLLAGEPDEDALRAAKYTGAFSGAIRPNLVALLDAIGVQRWLGIASCATLFGEHAHLMHVTAALRHPVFIDGPDGPANYNGASPDMMSNTLLRGHILLYFAQEAAQLRDALFIPLGPKVGSALDWLAELGYLDACRILHGLPHPSGANAERIAYFLGRKDKTTLSSRTNGARIDADRAALEAQMAALGTAPHKA